MATVLDEYVRYRRMVKNDQPPTVFISSMVGPIKSKYLQPCLLTVEEAGSSRNQFEFLPQRDSIAVLLYHRQKRQFLLIRRFRPALAASRVLQLPRNKGKAAGEINWSDCEEEGEDEIGWTVELCSGRVKSKKENLDETALAVVEEQFGLRVDRKYLQHIGSFLTGVTDSGTSCHLYYAELDCAEEIGDGKIGSNPTMHEYWMDVEKAMTMATFDLVCLMPSSHFYAFLWWSTAKFQSINVKDMKMTPNYGVDTRCPFSDRRRFRAECRNGLLNGKWRLSEKKNGEQKDRYPLMRLNYTINYRNNPNRPSFKTRDIALRPDTVSILIKDVDSAEIVMTRRFRPAALVGRVMGLPENEVSVVPETPWAPPNPIFHLPTPPSSPSSSPVPLPSTPEKLFTGDFSSYVSPWAFTFEPENETSKSVHSPLDWKTESLSPFPFAHLLTPPPSSSLPLPSTLDQLDFSAYPNSWAYTYELASTRIKTGEEAEMVARQIALRELGYAITGKELNFIGRTLMGSSEGGESKYLFYAECREKNRVRNWKEMKGVERVKFPLSTYALCLHPSNSPPSVHIALIFMYNNDKSRMTANDDAEREKQLTELDIIERELDECAVAAMMANQPRITVIDDAKSEEESTDLDWIEREWNENVEPAEIDDELEEIVMKVAKDGMENEEDEEEIDEMEMTTEKRKESEWLDSIHSIDSMTIVDSEDEKIAMQENEEEENDDWDWASKRPSIVDSIVVVDRQTDFTIKSDTVPCAERIMTDEEAKEYQNALKEEKKEWTADSFQGVDYQEDLVIKSESVPCSEDIMTEEEAVEQFGWADEYLH